MEAALNVYGLSRLVPPEQLAGGTVVVIDVLRASTTIIHALEAGAVEVIPCLEVEEARAAAANMAPGDVVLGGERGGLPIQGFDLGNSPSEYTPQTVGNRTVVFTTTNGTRAMSRCRLAGRVLIGAFVNASAISEQLVGQRPIHLLCAGTEGRLSRDDLLMAGLLVASVARRSSVPYRLNAQAVTARDHWASCFGTASPRGAEPATPPPEALGHQLRDSIAGRKLAAIGREEDILTAAQLDRFSTVPELDPSSFRIRRA